MGSRNCKPQEVTTTTTNTINTNATHPTKHTTSSINVTSTRKATETPGLSNFEDNVLKFHNQARASSGLSPLVWNKKLAVKARDWGMFLKENEECKIRHPLSDIKERNKYVPGTMGQNLYVSHGYPNDPSSGLDAVQKWYSECKDYKKPLEGQELPENFMGVGHFTQMMWAGNKTVGCSRIECPKMMKDSNGRLVEAKGSIVACNYGSGNVGGKFREEVPDDVRCEGQNLWIGM